MKFMLEIRKLLLLISLLLVNICSAYQYDFDKDQNIQAFGYLGYKQLFSNNNIENSYSRTSKPELGLNIIYNKGDFQIFNQFRYGEDSGTYLVYNFMQYTFNIANEINLSLKGGKLRHEFGLYNTTRVNPKTRQGVIQPQSIYWDTFDEFLTSGTGVGASLKVYDFELGFTYDDPTLIDQGKSTRVMVGPILNSIKDTGFGDHYIAYVNYTPKNIPLIVKSSFSSLNLGSNYSGFGRYVLPQIVNEDFEVSAITFGVEYDFDSFILSGETLLFKTPEKKWQDFDKLTKGFSVTGIYHINDNLDYRLNYNEYDSGLARKFTPTTPWLAYGKDLNCGFNYHFDSWMFQVEGHYINGAKMLDVKDVGMNVQDYKSWWMIGTNVVYSF